MMMPVFMSGLKRLSPSIPLTHTQTHMTSVWCIVSNKLRRIRSIERAAYPPHMRQMQDCRSWKDLAEYCEVSLDKVTVVLEKDYYLILAENGSEVEIVDLASKNGISPGTLMGLFRKILVSLSGKSVICDARAGTSLKVLHALSRAGKIKIQKDNKWTWRDDEMHSLKFVVI